MASYNSYIGTGLTAIVYIIEILLCTVVDRIYYTLIIDSVQASGQFHLTLISGNDTFLDVLKPVDVNIML